jgi:hypothetical protein
LHRIIAYRKEYSASGSDETYEEKQPKKYWIMMQRTLKTSKNKLLSKNELKAVKTNVVLKFNLQQEQTLN